ISISISSSPSVFPLRHLCRVSLSSLWRFQALTPASAPLPSWLAPRLLPSGLSTEPSSFPISGLKQSLKRRRRKLKVTTEEKNVACSDCFHECPWILAVINVLLHIPALRPGSCFPFFVLRPCRTRKWIIFDKFCL
ncbi:unnamed protein product, partial [Musa textilis]